MKRGNMMEKVAERFIKYVKFNTTSKDSADSYPSTSCQLVLAESLTEELKALGLSDVDMINTVM
jgi:tripeptide aminopeptidase